MKLPKIRENLLVQDLANEVLIYDKSTNKSYCLNETAKTVFNHCDGKKSIADLRLPEDVIYLSLDELEKNNLIQSDYVSVFAGMNRREVVRRVGLASMILLPVISSLIAPTATNAASGKLAVCAACIISAQCESNRCLQSNNDRRQACGNATTSQVAYQKDFTDCVPTNTDQNCSRFGSSFCCNGSATSGSLCGTNGVMPIYNCTCD